jgi:hypothetical protein
MPRNKFGIAFIALCVCASLVVVPAAATAASASAPTARTAAATPVKTLKTVRVSGHGKNGKKFTGHYTITHFVTKHGKPYAVGTLVGTLGHKRVNRSNVAIPVGVQHTSAAAAAACPILHLVLGPLNLNLLGLQVSLNQVVLDITAQSGPGNLLGNLLCSVAGLLNGPGAVGGGTITGLLNILQQLLNVPTLSAL